MGIHDDSLHLTIVELVVVDSNLLNPFSFVNFVPFVVKKNFRLGLELGVRLWVWVCSPLAIPNIQAVRPAHALGTRKGQP